MVISWAIHTDRAKGVRATRDAEARIKALRDAARMGVADIESADTELSISQVVVARVYPSGSPPPPPQSRRPDAGYLRVGRRTSTETFDEQPVPEPASAVQFTHELRSFGSAGTSRRRYLRSLAAACRTFSTLVCPVTFRIVSRLASARNCGMGFGKSSC